MVGLANRGINIGATPRMILENFIQLLDHPRRQGRGFVSKCPAHDDRNPSLSIQEGDKGILIRCWAGCSVDEICQAVNIKKKDLFFNSWISAEATRLSIFQKELNQKLNRVSNLESDLYRNAEEIVNAAHGIDISSWTPEEIAQALNVLAPAYKLLSIEEAKNHAK